MTPTTAQLVHVHVHVTGTVFVIVCPVCRFDADGYTDPAEAIHLTGVHNDVHHGHRPDAFVVATSIDEHGLTVNRPLTPAELLGGAR
jgi:hypothetical protein